MAETLLYSQRLHEITEKRSILSEVDKVQRELEQQRLTLQQLKRKSLRDRWLMDGLALAPGAEIDNPLSQTEGKIKVLEEQLESLKSQLFCLENPGVSRPRAEIVKECSVPKAELVNGEREEGEAETSLRPEDTASAPNVDNQEEKQDGPVFPLQEEQAPSTVRMAGHPIPAPRGKKAETPKQSQSEEPRVQNPEHLSQDVGDVQLNQEHQGHDLENMSQEHENQTAEELKKNHESQILGHSFANNEQIQSVLNQDQNHNLDRKVRVSEENEIQELSNNQVETQNQKQGSVQLAEEQRQETDWISQDQEQNRESILSQQHNQTKSQESLPVTQNEDPNESQESLLVTPDQNMEENENQSQELLAETQDKNPDSTQESQDMTQDNHQNPELSHQTAQNQSQIQNQEPISTPHEKSQDQNKNLEPKCITNKQNRGQNQNQELPPNTQGQNSTFQSEDQTQIVSPPAQGEEESWNPMLFSTEQQQASIQLPKDNNQGAVENQSSLGLSKEHNQVQISKVVVVAPSYKGTSTSQLTQHASTHPQGPYNSPQFSAAVGNSPPECQPLLDKPQGTDSSSTQATNTAETRGEKIRVKEKTCQCCVVM